MQVIQVCFRLQFNDEMFNGSMDGSVMIQLIAFDELKTDYKNPIDQCNSLNPVSSLFINHLQKRSSAYQLFIILLCCHTVYKFDCIRIRNKAFDRCMPS
jgi:hypothetical protein